MAEFPTKEKLEKLYHEKGRDVLVWYAWRNTLRVLPTLGYLPLQYQRTWSRESKISFFYSLCQPVLGLSQYRNSTEILNFKPGLSPEFGGNPAMLTTVLLVLCVGSEEVAAIANTAANSGFMCGTYSIPAVNQKTLFQNFNLLMVK